MPKKSSVPAEWVERLAEFRRFTSAEELARAHPPAHQVAAGAGQIWHYPLGVSGGTLYSIHVAVEGQDKPMAYMHMEPSDLPDTIQPVKKTRSWWRFW